MSTGKVDKRRLNPYNSYIFLSLCAFSLMSIADYVNAAVVSTSKILLIILTLFSLLMYIKNKEISKIFVAICIFWGVIAVSTVINNGYYLQLLRASFSSILLCITMEMGFKYNKRKTIRSFAFTWGSLAMINALSMFYYYSPTLSHRGMFRDGGGDTNYYFLGQDNGTIYYSIPASIMVALDSIEKKAKISWIAILYTAIIGLSYLRVFSGAGILAFSALLILEFLINIRKIGHFIHKKITLKKILIATFIVFLTIVAIRSSNIVVDTIAQYLEKNSSFTGRTRLWDIVIGHISKKPLLGYGLQDSVMRLQMIPYGKAHNMILQIIYNGGFVLLAAYLLACKKSFGEKRTYDNIPHKALLIGTFIILLMVSNFDFYIHHELTFLLMILFALYNSNLHRTSRVKKEEL